MFKRFLFYNYFQEIRSIFLEMIRTTSLPSAQGGRPVLLDIGCHDGGETKALAHQLNAIAFGVDINKAALALAVKNGINAHYCDVGKDPLPLESESVDLTISNQVIEHIGSPDLHLEEIWRVLKPGGMLILGTPNLAALHNRLLLLVGMQPTAVHISRVQLGNPLRGRGTNNREHINGFTRLGMKELLEFHHFKILKSYSTRVFLSNNFSIPFLHRIFPSLGHIQFWIVQK